QIECVAVLPPVLHRDERLPGLVLDRPFRMLLPQSRFLTNQKRREPQPRLEPSFVYPLHEPPQPMRKLAVYVEPVADVSLPAVVTNPATMLRPHSGEKTAVIRSETNRPALASGCVLGAITDGAIGTSSPEHSSSSVGDQLCHPCL